jgi:hypothetical protein
MRARTAGDRVRGVPEDEVYKVVLVVSEARGGRGSKPLLFCTAAKCPKRARRSTSQTSPMPTIVDGRR